MKSLWIIISTLAVANLLALAVFAGWLYGTDRISRERVEKIRAMLAPTIAAEARAAAEEKAKAEAAAETARKEEKAKGPPESSAESVERQRAEDDTREQARIRRERELADLARQLVYDRQVLDEDRAKLAASKKAFGDLRAGIARKAKDEQFQQALSTLESQKPKDAHAVLSVMMQQKQEDEVVAYLTAMDEGKRAKIMAEFVKQSDKVAADLLQRIKTSGVAAAGGGTSP